MANTTTGRYAFTKPEIGAATDSWGTLLNTNWDDADSQILRKLDKSMVKSNSQTITITGSSKRITTTTTKGFQNIEVGDKIFISGSDPAGQTNDGIHTVTAIDNTNWLYVDCSGSTLYDDGPQTITWGLVTQIARTEISTVDIDSGTIDGATIATSDITVGSGKTLDVQSGTLTTSSTQKDEIVDGSTAITRSSNDLTFAGNVDVTGDVTVTGGDIKSSGGTTAISVSSANTTLAGTANNVGTVTAGTIDHTVTMTGVPRRKKIKNFSSSSSGSTHATAKLVAIGTISYPVVNGRTYLIQASYRTFTNHTSSSGTSFRIANYGIAYGASDRSDEDGISTDTVLQSVGIQYYIDGSTLPRHVGHASNIGAYTYSGSDTTHYAYVFRESGTSDVETNVSQLFLTVEEFDSDNLD